VSKPSSAEPRLGAFHFRADATLELGTGHLRRCISLAAAARNSGASVRFTVLGDPCSAKLAAAEGYAVGVHDLVDFREQARRVASLTAAEDIAVLDFVHARALADVEGAAFLLRAWKRAAGFLVLIDGAADQALRARHPALEADMVVAPYAGEDRRGDEPYRLVAGAKYAILPAAFTNLPRRKVRRQADRVLVSCGGSDPHRVTLGVLRDLEKVDRALEVRVIVGPLFDRAIGEDIDRLARASRHRVAGIHAPASLVEQMLWCDAAICTSGLVKYELAASGTPALLIALDAGHLSADAPFVSERTIRHLGLREALTARAIADAIDELLSDQNVRQDMATRGQALVDGRGAERVVAEVERCATIQ
jgi:UDP-2,4-diacetamido-2,4,6-trideoxy-beta-L-altropyranose hydrolase